MERDWKYLKDKYGIESARIKFEEICEALIRKMYPDEKVHGNDGFTGIGDDGIDIFIEGSESIRVYQCKYFIDGFGNTQKSQIRDSFNRARLSKTFNVTEWTLLIPVELDIAQNSWWIEWKNKNEAKYKIKINIIKGRELLENLKEFDLYNNYFDIKTAILLNRIDKKTSLILFFIMLLIVLSSILFISFKEINPNIEKNIKEEFMGNILSADAIDEFADYNSVKKTAISKEVIDNIRKLDEETQIEQFIRDIISDPNETPHGPTEIADILTHHLHINGQKRLAAFVLKGKSFKKVTSREISHQFMKLRQLKDIDIIILAASGNIHDDAQRDFIQTATDMDCNYLILDSIELARLFIAYHKICPKDGTVYDDNGLCEKEHQKSSELTLEIKVPEEVHYSIVKHEDSSSVFAKSYAATVIVDKHYTKDTIKNIILEVKEQLKQSNYYRTAEMKAYWKKRPAHVVRLYIAHDQEDRKNYNWVCQAIWIDDKLPESDRPSVGSYDEIFEKIKIQWNSNYNDHRELWLKKTGTKEQFMDTAIPIIDKMTANSESAIEIFQKYKKGQLNEKKLLKEITKFSNKIGHLYSEAGNEIPLPPEDCKMLYYVCNQLFANSHNIYLYYSESGLNTWDRKTRDWFMEKTIERHEEMMLELKIERKRVF